MRGPGNVRELEHAIERAVILARGTTVTVRELPPEVVARAAPGRTRRYARPEGTGTASDRQAFENVQRNRKRAAEALNISPVTLWRKMKDYGLTP